MTSTLELITADSWAYVVYSFRMIDGKSKKIRLWVNNANTDGELDMTGVFQIDHADYKNYIAIRRTDNSPDTFSNRWNGFLYDFHLYQTEYDSTTAIHFKTSCASACNTRCPSDNTCPWLNPFETFDDGAGADEACESVSCSDKSCVRTQNC